MLKDDTLMRTKNKMDSKARFEEWWEVAKEYFTKELEKNLVQHSVDERILKYKLKVCQKKFQISFVAIHQIQRYQAKMKQQKQGLVGQFKRRKYKLKNHNTSKVEYFWRRRYNQRYHKTL
jgi:hypothetical protein